MDTAMSSLSRADLPGSTHIIRARVVLADRILEDSSVLLEDGEITAVAPEGSRSETEIDLGGRFLLPGLVDLHCDALEKEIEPRPNVRFPVEFALAQADKRNASAGITTIFHALSFASGELGVRDSAFAADIARRICRPASKRIVDHRTHCRYEITDVDGLSVLHGLLDESAIHLLSVMDHTPGQGQFKELSAYRDFLAKAYGQSKAEATAVIERKFDNAEGASERIGTLASRVRELDLPFASHDDDCLERVETMVGFGATISEFPVNLETARAARVCGMATMFGAPNVVRGKSQVGALRAIEAIEAGVADCLCADYVPATLLAAPFYAATQTDLSLPDAIALVTRNPARAARLDDRGEIAVGKRADLVAVEVTDNIPHVSMLWHGGRVTYSAGAL